MVWGGKPKCSKSSQNTNKCKQNVKRESDEGGASSLRLKKIVMAFRFFYFALKRQIGEGFLEGFSLLRQIKPQGTFVGLFVRPFANFSI